MYYEKATIYQVHDGPKVPYALFQIGEVNAWGCDPEQILSRIALGYVEDKLASANILTQMPIQFFLQWEEK